MPRNISMFASNPLFGEPGIYPAGSPMLPASGESWGASECCDLLESMVGSAGVDQFDDPVLAAMCPDFAPRAALVLLSLTVAAPLVDGFLEQRTPVSSLSIGVTRAPGRVVGPVAAAIDTVRVVNDRYRAEHPALMAPSIGHDLLWNVSGAGQYEEATLHMLVALIYLQLVAISPAIAHTGTELARRQNSLAISLLNSRNPNESTLRVIAPNGPGTIPGGAPSMQSPDFWSIPFVRGEPNPSPAPEFLAPVLRRIAGDDAVFEPTGDYCQVLGERLTASGLGGALDPAQQLRVMVILGLLDDQIISSAAGIAVPDVLPYFGLADVGGLFN